MDQGYLIFFVEDVGMEGGKRFEEVSPEIEEKLYNAAVDKKYAEWLDELKRPVITAAHSLPSRTAVDFDQIPDL